LHERFAAEVTLEERCQRGVCEQGRVRRAGRLARIVFVVGVRCEAGQTEEFSRVCGDLRLMIDQADVMACRFVTL
jgi:hypothetical protein